MGRASSAGRFNGGDQFEIIVERFDRWHENAQSPSRTSTLSAVRTGKPASAARVDALGARCMTKSPVRAAAKRLRPRAVKYARPDRMCDARIR